MKKNEILRFVQRLIRDNMIPYKIVVSTVSKPGLLYVFKDKKERYILTCTPIDEQDAIQTMKYINILTNSPLYKALNDV